MVFTGERHTPSQVGPNLFKVAWFSYNGFAHDREHRPLEHDPAAVTVFRLNTQAVHRILICPSRRGITLQATRYLICYGTSRVLARFTVDRTCNR